MGAALEIERLQRKLYSFNTAAGSAPRYGENASLCQLTEEEFVFYAEAQEDKGKQEVAVAVEGPENFRWKVSTADVILEVE